MEILLSSKTNNYLVTHAVGDSYYKNLKENSLPSWLLYCKRHGIGIILIKTLIPSEKKKNVYWEKFLIPNVLKRLTKIKVENICYLDTDVIINPLSPDIFSVCDLNKVNLVSQVKNLPYVNRNIILKKIAYHRNNHNKNYPLNSSLFMPVNEIFKYHGLAEKDDYACTGLFVLNVDLFADAMMSWYAEVPEDVTSLDNGEEVYLNHFFLERTPVNWLGYEWQAIWMFEVANSYSFIYEAKNDGDLIKKCITNSLKNFNFLHFAGSWESFCWHECKRMFNEDSSIFHDLLRFREYRDSMIVWTPVGQVRPKYK